MQHLNNLDIIILVILGLSALIALSRGLIKEVLSIIGWVLAAAAVIYLLPVFTPITKEYIPSGMVAGVVTALFILILFMVIWILLTGGVVNKIRSSKLGGLDRLLGLFFGIMRAFLLVILLYILISWMMPDDRRPELFKNSKYFNLAGEFAAPVENLISKETLDMIRKKTNDINNKLDPEAADKKEAEDEKPAKDENKKADDVDALFEKLAQPQVKKLREDKKKLEKIHEDFKGYNNSERDNLDRLIENTLE